MCYQEYFRLGLSWHPGEGETVCTATNQPSSIIKSYVQFHEGLVQEYYERN